MANVVYMDKVIWSVNLGKMVPSSNTWNPPTEHTPFPIASLAKVLTVSAFEIMHVCVFLKAIDK